MTETTESSGRTPVIAIVGMGRVGRALGSALQRVKTNYVVWGHDRDPDVTRDAAKARVVDKTSWNLIEVVDGSDLVFLAEPISELRATLEAIAPHVRDGTLITDTAGTKVAVMAMADELVPEGVSFVGGHPILDAAFDGDEADWFIGASYALVPAERASDTSLTVLGQLVTAIGAKPYYIGAEEHDALVAGVRHLPFLLASSLGRIVGSSASLPDLHRLAGAEVSLVLSIADTDAGVRQDVVANRAHLVGWLDAVVADLAAVREAITSDDAARLETLLAQADSARERWEAGSEAAGTSDSETMRELEDINPLRDMIFGRGFRRRKD